MSKTNYLQAVISDLQRTAGPYRCAITGRERMQQTTCANASLFDHFVGGGDERRRHSQAQHSGGLMIDH